MERDQGESFKGLCANYGAAMYFAQVLEHGIANALVHLELIPKTRGLCTPDEYDAFYEGQFAKTLGNLVRSLRAVSGVPDSLVVALNNSRDRRSYLAHHFFREASDSVFLGEYELLLEQLEEHRAQFAATDKLLQEFVRPVMERYGFTDEALERAMREYGDHLRQDA